jgi:hypothetical protein
MDINSTEKQIKGEDGKFSKKSKLKQAQKKE